MTRLVRGEGALEESLASLRAVLERAADGELDVCVDPRSVAGAAEPLARALNRLLTRWRETADEWQRREAKYRGLVEEGHAVSYVVNLRNGAIHVTMDEQMEVLLGFTRQEWEADWTLLGQRLHPNDAERVLSAKAAAIQRGEALATEYRVRCRSGVTLWVHDDSNVVRDDHGAVCLRGVAINITARHHAEEALQESRQRFDRMANRLPHVIFRWGPAGLEYVSPACFEMLGYTPEEIFASRFPGQLVTHPLDWDRLIALAPGLAHGPIEFESRMLRKDGGLVWAENHFLPIYNDEGELLAVEGVTFDISERKHMELVVREREELFHTLATLSPVGIFRTNGRGHCTYVTEHWSAIAGITLPEALGDGWLRALHPDDRDRVVAEWEHAVRERSVFRAEHRFQRRDGRIVWVLGQALAETAPDGELRGYVGTITDITDRKAAEQALQASDARYRHMFEHAAVSLWEEDFSAISKRLEELRAQGVDPTRYLHSHPEFIQWAIENVRVLDVNQQSLELFGAQSKEQLLAELVRICLPETYAVFAAEVLAIAAGEPFFRAQAPVLTLDGRRREVLATIAFPPPRSPDTPTLVSLVDITEHKQAEEALLDAERGKHDAARAATDAERRRLAHELHDGVLQDLGAIKLILEAEARRGLGNTLAPALERIAAVISEVRGVVDDLQPGDLFQGSLEAALAAHARWLTRPRGIALALEFDPDVRIETSGVRDLYRIAQEALANAVSHGRPTRIAVRLRKRACDTVLEVADDGAGFDVTAPHRGMGLPSMRERAAALGGDLEITSIAGEGTSVRIAIPGGAANTAAPPLPAAAASQG